MMQDDDIYSMKIQQTQARPEKATVTQKYYPGFACFFESYLQKNSFNFNECFKKMLVGHQQINFIDEKISDVLNKKELSLNQKSSLFETKIYPGQRLFYYYKPQDTDQSMKLRTFQEVTKKRQETQKLKNQLHYYQQKRRELTELKKQQFRLEKQQREKLAASQAVNSTDKSK